ncbi:hypothetical protein RJ035_001257 [Blastomyces gilchristii]
MGIEMAAVEGMLDDTHPTIAMGRDESIYTFGFGLLVGIGGGIPVDGEHDIRLGDVVVGKPTDTFGGVVQFDRGKIYKDGRFERTGALSKPPNLLLGTVEKLRARHYRQGSEQIPQNDLKSSKDLLFEATYFHPEKMSTCRACDPSRLVNREERYEDSPEVHYVIRGVCDYADSHKNKEWQPYAAVTATAHMRELLETIPASEVKRTPPAAESFKDPPDMQFKDKVARLEKTNQLLEQSNQSHAKDIESLKAELKASQKEFRKWTASGGRPIAGQQFGGSGGAESINPNAGWVGMIRKDVVDAAIKGKHDEFKRDCVELKRTILTQWAATVVNDPSVAKFFEQWFHSPRLLYVPGLLILTLFGRILQEMMLKDCLSGVTIVRAAVKHTV